VRRVLAERLAKEARAPRELVVALANDEVSVARPILLDCELLADSDLIEIIHQRTLQHQLTIAMRRQISETVSAALVSTGKAEVMRILVENPHARIGRRTYERLVEHSRSVETLRTPLIGREDMDPDLAGRMYQWVSAALRRQIVLNFDIEPKLLDEALADSVRKVLVQHGQPSQSVASDAIAEGRDDPGILLQLLRAGEVQLFEVVLARKTGLKLTQARRAFYEPGGGPLAIACKAIEIEKAQFAAIFLLARQARPGEQIVDPGELQRILAFFDGLSVASARMTLDAWRSGAESPGSPTRL
jgi:uncharacterized protein (DUF2336 family)